MFTVKAARVSSIACAAIAWTGLTHAGWRVGLVFDLQLRIKHLSKGNKQKVGILQALMPRPALLMLDEPTAGLDPLMQQQVLRAIREAQAHGATVFFSSHVLSEVEEIADRVGIIRRGVVVEIADPQALIDRALRRVQVRFKRPIEPSALTRLPGVTLIDQSDGSSVLLNVAGDMDQSIKTLAAYPVIEMDTERPSLEDISGVLRGADVNAICSICAAALARTNRRLGCGAGRAGVCGRVIVRHGGQMRNPARTDAEKSAAGADGLHRRH